MEYHMPVLHCISSFEVTSYKSLKIQLSISSFISFCYTSAFTSADIICNTFLELHLSLSEKKI